MIGVVDMKKRILSGLAALCMIPLIAPVSAEPSASDITAVTQEVSVEDRIYCIASVSKVYTAAAVMQLADEGKLSLDDGTIPNLVSAMDSPEHLFDCDIMP